MHHPALLLSLLLSSLLTAHASSLFSITRLPTFTRRDAPLTRSLQGRRLRSRCAFQPKSDKSIDMQTLLDRRVPIIVASTTNASQVPSWLSTIDSTGKWPDSEIDYTTGCDAQRANWPAQSHWLRINTLAAVWLTGVNGTSQYHQNPDVLTAISNAMDWWFARDFTNPSCLDNGGNPPCPCGTPGLWNTNWFSNIDLIPTIVAESCLLLSNVLTPDQQSNCSHITLRSYGTFDHNINGVGFLTGANTLDVTNIGVDIGLLNNNESIITDAYRRAHNEIAVQNAVHADGIRPDGSFGQHAGLLYNGNYGKDYTNDVLKMELLAAGTTFEANDTAKQAVVTLLDGDAWMIYTNTLTQVEHWDISALPRFISFPVADGQATATINLNISQLDEIGHDWKSQELVNIFNRLDQKATTANTGDLIGSRAFWNNDYYVQRGINYVTTVKGYSTRSLNTECTNSQNPFGFHLSDGTVFTYVQGNEYEDIAAAWDWNLIPGTTTDYNGTVLNCDTARVKGVESFVGGVSNGSIGAFAMNYTNPTTKSLHWQKSWFFFPNDVQHVVVSGISTNSTHPIFSVLDQKLHNGNVYVDGNQVNTANFTSFKSLWHSNVGYTFDSTQSANAELVVAIGTHTGSWSTIGTSKQPPSTVDLFSASLQHQNTQNAVSYTIYPGKQLSDFNTAIQSETLVTLAADNNTHAMFDTSSNLLLTTFWSAAGGKVSNTNASPQYTVTTNSPCIVIVDQNSWNVTVADPSQQATSLTVELQITSGTPPAQFGGSSDKTLTFTLPTGGFAGQSLTQAVS